MQRHYCSDYRPPDPPNFGFLVHLLLALVFAITVNLLAN